MKNPNRKIRWLNGLLLAVVLAHSVYRDIQLERQYTPDLRNRVVGARLEKDHQLPYTYSWRASKGVRYYDEYNANWDSNGSSNITASPFFHQLLFPICDLPENTISKIWLLGEYLFLAGIILIILTLTKDTRKNWLIINTGILFTLTEAWKLQVATGQLYIFEAFLMSVIIAGFISNKKTGMLIAGIFAAVFILTRPIGIVLFIPCLFYYRRTFVFLTTAFSLLAVYGAFVITSPYQQALYKDYAKGMKGHVWFHQVGYTTYHAVRPADVETYSYFEGIDLNVCSRLAAEHPIKKYSENGNIFVLYKMFTGSRISTSILSILLVITLVILSAFFLWKSKTHSFSLMQIVLFGMTLYLIVELFTPIHRHQYNTVQWFPLLLAGILVLSKWKNPVSILMIVGLLLNISNMEWLPMRHTIGEYCWLAALLILSFSTRIKTAV